MARLVFLGRLADAAGCPEAPLAVEDVMAWNALVARLETDFGSALASAVAEPRVRLALNGVVLADRAGLALRQGDELAFLPPVSGG